MPRGESIGVRKELPFRMHVGLAERAHDVGVAAIRVVVAHGVVGDQRVRTSAKVEPSMKVMLWSRT